MYVNVARAALALVALFAIQVLPAQAQSSLEFRVGQSSSPARQGVVQTGAFKLMSQDGRTTLGPPSSPPELMPSGGENITPGDPQRSVNGNGAEGGEVIFDGSCSSCNGGSVIVNGGCPMCNGGFIVNGGCPTCNGGDVIVGGGCTTCNGCGGITCNGNCYSCGHHCGGGCNSCGGCHTCNVGCSSCNTCCSSCNTCCSPCNSGCCGMSCEGDCNTCCGNSCGCGNGCDECWGPPWWYRGLLWCGHVFDHSQFFFAGDGWKNRLDDDDANNFGYRIGFNLGIPFLPERCVGLQFGTSFGVYDLHGREDDNRDESEGEGMLTVGLFKHCCFDCCDCWTWAAVYDYQGHNNVGEDGDEFIHIGQFRFLLGRALSECNEVGFWTAIAGGDTQFVDGNHVRGMDQFNVYWRHYYESGADTNFYLGLAESPGQFVFGFNGTAPLNQSLALFGGVHYISPSAGAGDPGFSEEVWNVSFGIVWYPGCNACPGSICGRQWMPVLPVADNGSFALAAPSHARF